MRSENRRHKVQIIRQIVDQLHPSETCIDESLGQVGRLLTATCEARIDSGQPATTAQHSIAHMVAVVGRLGEARASLLAAHGSLLIDKKVFAPELGGDEGCPPQPKEFFTSASAEHVIPIRAA